MQLFNTTTLIVPDAHEGPSDDSTERNRAIGNLLVSARPERLVILGDFLDIESLSAWDMDKRLVMEGRRYRADVDAGNRALDTMLAPLAALQEKQRQWKEKIYRPEMIFCMGNHEDRLRRYVERHPELHGAIDIKVDLKLEDRGFITVGYGEFYKVPEGVQFTHVPLNDANQAPGGKYAIERTLELVATSTIFGHLHRWCSVDSNKHGSDSTLKVLSAGCSFEHTPPYVRGASSRFWRGVALIHHTMYGNFDVEQFSVERLKRLYG